MDGDVGLPQAQPDSGEEEDAPRVPEWLQGLQSAVSNEELRVMATSTSFREWLDGLLGKDVAAGCRTLASLSADPSTRFGWRLVTPKSVSAKAAAFAHTMAWVGPRIALRNQGDCLPFYQSGHQRAVALHYIFFHHWNTGAVPPDWAVKTARSIEVQVLSDTAVEARLYGLVKAASSMYGTTKFNTYDVLCLMDDLQAEESVTMETFRSMIAKRLPDLSQNEHVFPWKRLKDMALRVSKQAILRITELSTEMASADIFPPQWWRDPRFKLPSARSSAHCKDNLSPLSQEIYVARVVAEIRLLLSKQNITSASSPTLVAAVVPGLLRTMSEDRRLQIRDLAVRFAEGAFSAKFRWTEAEHRSLISAFESGSVDASLKHAPAAPATWPCVRQLILQRKKLEEEERRQKIAEDLASRRAMLADAAKKDGEQRETHLQHLVALRQVRVAEHHSKVLEESEKLLATAHEKLVASDEEQRKTFQTKVAERIRFHDTLINETSLPDEWKALIEDKKVVVLLDYNALDDGPQSTVPNVLRTLLTDVAAKDLIFVILLPVSSKVTSAEMKVLHILMDSERPIFHLGFQLSDKCPWSDSSHMSALLVASEDTEWVTAVADGFQKQGKAKVSFSPTLRGENRHPLGSNHRCFGKQFWEQFLCKVSGVQVICDLEVGQAQLLDALQGMADPPLYLCSTLQHHSPARRDAVVRKFPKFLEGEKGDQPWPSLSDLEIRLDIEIPGELAQLYELRKHCQPAEAKLLCCKLPEKSAPRKMLTRELDLQARISAHLPPNLSMAQGLGADLALYPSLFGPRLAVIPARDFMPGEVIMTIKGPWTKGKHSQDSKALQLQFLNSKGGCVLSVHLGLDRSPARLLHDMDGDVDHPLNHLKSELSWEWRLSTTDDPWLLLRATTHVKKFESELAIRWPQDSPAGELAPDEPVVESVGGQQTDKGDKRPAAEDKQPGPKKDMKKNQKDTTKRKTANDDVDQQQQKKARQTETRPAKTATTEDGFSDDEKFLESLLGPNPTAAAPLVVEADRELEPAVLGEQSKFACRPGLGGDAEKAGIAAETVPPRPELGHLGGDAEKVDSARGTVVSQAHQLEGDAKPMTVAETDEYKVQVTQKSPPSMTLIGKSKRKTLSAGTVLFKAEVPSPLALTGDDQAHLLLWKLCKSSKIQVGPIEQTLGQAIEEHNVVCIEGVGPLKGKGAAIPKSAFEEDKFIKLGPSDMVIFCAAGAVSSLACRFQFSVEKFQQGDVERKKLQLKACLLVCEKRTTLSVEDVD